MCISNLAYEVIHITIWLINLAYVRSDLAYLISKICNYKAGYKSFIVKGTIILPGRALG